MNWYKQNGAFFAEPQVGDQIFFSNDGWATSYHTGLVVGVVDGRVYTIEGNTSSGAAVVANGGCVAEKNYPVGYARYGRPNYSLVENKTFERDDEIMTGEQIYEKLNEYLREQPCPDWAKAELAEAVKMGITDGTRPCELIPRYQAAIMAKRAISK
jgi:hypothetical protein